MTSKFDRELEKLNNQIIEMGKNVEDIVKIATNGFVNFDISSVNQVINDYPDIETQEREIETLSLKLLLKQQPVATDFRTISAILKIITDIRRIGTQALDIAQLTSYLIEQNQTKKSENITKMSNESIKIVVNSIKSFINKDLEAAKDTIIYDDVVDALFINTKEELVELIKKDLINGQEALDLIMIAKYFEKIGDHAVNIARWTVFSITGVHPE